MSKMLQAEGALKQRLDLVEKVHSVLYKYTHKKLNFLCSIPALALLLEKYLQAGPIGEPEGEILAKTRATLD